MGKRQGGPENFGKKIKILKFGVGNNTYPWQIFKLFPNQEEVKEKVEEVRKEEKPKSLVDEIRPNAICKMCQVHGDQLYMAVFFWNLVNPVYACTIA